MVWFESGADPNLGSLDYICIWATVSNRRLFRQIFQCFVSSRPTDACMDAKLSFPPTVARPTTSERPVGLVLRAHAATAMYGR